MNTNSKPKTLLERYNNIEEPKKFKFKDELILLLGLILFVAATVYQARFSAEISGWQGVIAQVQVMASVFMVVYVPKKGYIVALVINVLQSIIVTFQVTIGSNPRAMPGIFIPVCTIVIVSIIELYASRLLSKADEVIEEQKRRTDDILELQEVSIMAMAALAETRDHETGKHIQRTKNYVKILAYYLYNHNKYSDELDLGNIELIIASAPLHDIGKVGIPDSILLKPGKLTEEEFDEIKKHTIMGYEAIMKAEKLMGKSDTFLKYAQSIVLSHHERWDGLGYMYQLKGENIPLAARIMSLADMYDALTSKRVYKEIHPHEDAYETIVEESGKRFDPEVVKAFIACHKEFEAVAKQYKESE